MAGLSASTVCGSRTTASPRAHLLGHVLGPRVLPVRHQDARGADVRASRKELKVSRNLDLNGPQRIAELGAGDPLLRTVCDTDPGVVP